MEHFNGINGVIFDYGGTIDSRGVHWSEVIWDGYVRANVPVSKSDFRECYVFAERELARVKHIYPEHNFHDMLLIKMRIELENLVSAGKIGSERIDEWVKDIAGYCYGCAKDSVEEARPVLEALHARFPMVLVSNFYGNVETVLADFDLHKNNFPIDFDPLADTLPAEVEALFDKAVAAARASDEDALLDACHAIEAYFKFPKPNLLVKEAEVPGGMYSNMVAQLKALNSEDVLDEAMRLIPKVRRDAGLVPLVTPTSQIVGSQAVSLALDRKKGNPDYTNKSNQFIALIKGEYGKTPVAVTPEFREKITGSPIEHPYDVSSYKAPENPTIPELGGCRLAENDQEYLLLQLLPSVANGFLRKRRESEHKAVEPEPAKAEAPKADDQPITGPVERAPMGGKVIKVCVKAGDSVKKGDLLVVYEAMKMENELTAEKDSVVKRVFVAVDDVVGTDAPLIEFEG